MLNKNDTTATDKSPVTVPYVVYNDTVANYQWVIQKMVIALVIVVALMFASNIAWLYVWQKYDYAVEEITTTIDSEGEGIANYTGGNGGVILGESRSQEGNSNAD